MVRQSILYLRSKIAEATTHENDVRLDALSPYMLHNEYGTVPNLEFSSSLSSSVVPDFYEQFPIYTEDDTKITEYDSVYKIVDSDDLDEIQLFDVADISYYPVDVVAINAYIAWSTDLITTNVEGYELFTTFLAEDFEFDKDTGMISLTSASKKILLSRRVDSINDYYFNKLNVFTVLEFQIEKFRTISDLRDMSQEDVTRIATMQSVGASVLEYMYQFNLGTQAQMALQEIAYTALVTVISTAIASVTTWGLGKIAHQSLSTLSSKQASETASETSSKLLKRLKNWQTGVISRALSPAAGLSAIKVVESCVMETGQELFLDPWIEAAVTGLTRSWGWDGWAQMLASSLAEGARESLTGPINKMLPFSKESDSSFDQLMREKYDKTTAQPDLQTILADFNEYRANIQAEAEASSWSQQLGGLALSTIGFFTTAVSGGLVNFLGPAFSASFSTLQVYCKTEQLSVKNVYANIFGKSQPQITDYISTSGEDPIAYIDDSHNQDDVSDKKQHNWGKVIKYATIGISVAVAIGVGIWAFSNYMSSLTSVQSPSLPQAATDTLKTQSENTFLTTQGVASQTSYQTQPITKINLNPQLMLVFAGTVAGTVGISLMVKKSLQSSLKGYIEGTNRNILAKPISKNPRITSNTNTQVILKKIWKLQQNDGKFVFGMIYKWTNKENGREYVGRTEQQYGSRRYPPVSGISIRFDQELRKAINSDIEILMNSKNQMYYDMRVIYDKNGGPNGGLAAILEVFTLEIEDIIFISDNFRRDCKFIEAVEDYYIDKSTQELSEESLLVYNVGSGGSGHHISYLRSGHFKERQRNTIINMISEGFSVKEISEYFEIPYTQGELHSKILRLIKISTGKSYTQNKLEFIGERMIRLIDEGSYSFSQLASLFKGMNSLEVLRFFAGINFELGNEYLKGLISSAILKLKKEGKVIGANGISYNSICDELGIDSYSASHTISKFMKQKMKTLLKLTTDDLIKGLKFYGSRLITTSQDAFDLLKKLNYDDGLIYSIIIAQRIENLFGTTYDDAKLKYSSKIL